MRTKHRRYPHRFTVKSRATTKNASHERQRKDSSADTVGTIPGRIRPLSGFERQNASQVMGTVTHELETGYNPTIALDSTMFLVWTDRSNRTFSIESVVRDEETERVLIVMLKETTA